MTLSLVSCLLWISEGSLLVFCILYFSLHESFFYKKEKNIIDLKGESLSVKLNTRPRLILRVSHHVQFFLLLIVSGAKQAFSISFLQVFLSKIHVKMTLAIGDKLKLDIMYLLIPMFSTAF